MMDDLDLMKELLEKYRCITPSFLRSKYNISRNRALSLIRLLIREKYAVCLKLNGFMLFCKRGVELVIPVNINDSLFWIDTRRVLDTIKSITRSTISYKISLSPSKIARILELPQKSAIILAISALIKAIFNDQVIALKTKKGIKYIIDINTIKKTILPTSEKLENYLCNKMEIEKTQCNIEESELISVHIPHGLLELIDKIADREKMSRSCIIRKAISELLDKYAIIIEAFKNGF